MFWTKNEDESFYHFVLKPWGKLVNWLIILLLVFLQIGIGMSERKTDGELFISAPTFLVISLVLLMGFVVGNGALIKYHWRNSFNGKKMIRSGGLRAWFSSAEMRASFEK